MKTAHNVFANVDKGLWAFSRSFSTRKSISNYSSLKASGGAFAATIPGGPERSAGSLGMVAVNCVSEAYSRGELLNLLFTAFSMFFSPLSRFKSDKTVYGNNCTLNNDPELGK